MSGAGPLDEREPAQPHGAAAQETFLHPVADIVERRLGEQVHIAAALVSLGQLYARTNQGNRCESHVREAIGLYRKVFPQGNLLIVDAQGTLGECLLAQHKLTEAEPLLRDSIEQLGDRHCIQRRMFLESLVKLYNSNNDVKSAHDTQARLRAFSGQLRSQ